MSDQWGSSLAITVEGILKQRNSWVPIMPGVLLYKSLTKSHRVTLITDTSAKAPMEHFLKINGLLDHGNVVYQQITDPRDIADRRLVQLARLKTQGPLSMLLESDTTVAEKVFMSGTPVFLYLHPEYMRPEHRPDYKEELPSWDSLVSEIKRQQTMRIQDTRLHDDL